MEYLLVYLVVGVICGFICSAIASNRGMEGGFLWGFFLGIIGIIVVAVRPNDGNSKSSSQKEGSKEKRVYYCKYCNKTFGGYNEEPCPHCKSMLAPTTILLSEWMSYSIEKRNDLKAEFGRDKLLFTEDLTQETEKQKIEVQSNAEEIRKYKALVDDGIITSEEFEAKKKQLLGL